MSHRAKISRNSALRGGSERTVAPLERSADVSGYPGPGDVNAYECDDCGRYTVVVHVDQGVTPMFLACRATVGCTGRAHSTGYQLDPSQLPGPEWEWYRPTGFELRALSFPAQDHVRQGGLILRKRGPQ